ncbi:hypothetical protein [Streptacidiphilus sp. MAP5-3]|uniref:hypothetical protein n=1 Tax=unclassified Streptacidiphilus TaxID=2643834 RepID=UPI003517A599
MNDTEVLHFWVRKSRGDGITVTVYNAANGQVAVERAAGSRLELDALGAQYGVPEEQWMIDDYARAVIDAKAA